VSSQHSIASLTFKNRQECLFYLSQISFSSTIFFFRFLRSSRMFSSSTKNDLADDNIRQEQDRANRHPQPEGLGEDDW